MRNLMQRIIIWYMKHTTPLFRKGDVVVGAFETSFYFELIKTYEERELIKNADDTRNKRTIVEL